MENASRLESPDAPNGAGELKYRLKPPARADLMPIRRSRSLSCRLSCEVAAFLSDSWAFPIHVPVRSHEYPSSGSEYRNLQ